MVEILHTFPTYQYLQKDVWNFFILFRTWVICQNQKTFGFYKLTKARFIDKSESKQGPTHPSVEFRQITCNHSPDMEMALVFMWNSFIITKV